VIGLLSDVFDELLLGVIASWYFDGIEVDCVSTGFGSVDLLFVY
jgi:hypothetical protein